MASFSSDQPMSTAPAFGPAFRRVARDALRRFPSPHYLLGLAAALPLVALVFARFGVSGRSAVGAFFVASLALLSVIDIVERRLPNRIVLPSAAAVLAAQTLLFPDRTLEWMVAAIGASLVLLVPLLVHPAGLGMGDVKLALLLGAALGSAVITAFLVGFLAAAAYALVLLVRHGLVARHQTIPLGPFLAFGGIAALLL